MKRLQELPLEGKKVLVRVDFNAPLDDKGNITDDSRIKATLPTLKFLLNKNAAIILMSHLGRPKGKDPALSLAPCAKGLSELLKRPVKMAKDVVGKEVEEEVKNLKPGEILLLENLRFYPAEEKPEKDPSFAKQIASYGDFYIDDAFGCAHRNHTSITKVPEVFIGKAAPGLLLEKEINFLSKILKNPEHPFLALIGGAKVSTKIGVLEALVDKVDVLAIGGAMAYTFLKGEGYEIGDSLHEDDFIEKAQEIVQKMNEKGKTLLLPVDFVIAQEIKEGASSQIIDYPSPIPKGWKGVDIGPKTVKRFIESINKAKLILWNGPMGVFEVKPFDQGTMAVGKSFAESSAVTVAGGGETVAALNQLPDVTRVSHISTGGGATLEFIEFGTLPGIEIFKEP